MTERDLAELLRRNPDLGIADSSLSRLADDVNKSFRGAADALRGMESALPKSRLSEHELQAAVIIECDRRAILRPEYGLIFAIPNGGARHPAVAAKLKAEGVKAGVPDLFLPVARHGYHGLFIELKAGDNKPSEAQFAWIRNLKAEGYRCEVPRDSVEQIIERIEWYLEG